ncbi:nuclear transcription factor Y subunit B-1-like [Juglans regia]|uniref:Nuclear transcription factor Y subunit B-1-like n=1 Tax=Juglans regia TaxID=51240 RepID=A0A6P9EEB5_JUGRE|nr:nuclear transcription factor Y subunit B-1-like [Juglans regia]
MTGKRTQTSPLGSPPSSSGNISDDSSSKDQDKFLPIANVSRIMKRSLPTNAKISKEAKETVQECVSEYISFVTGEASDKCQREKRKTINGDDLLWAMMTLGFENYVKSLRNYLGKYREIEGENSMDTQGDKPPSTDSCPDHDFHQRFSGGFYSFGPQETPKTSFGECGRVAGCEENSVIGAFKVNGIRENGDGDGNRSSSAAEAHLHQEIDQYR